MTYQQRSRCEEFSYDPTYPPDFSKAQKSIREPYRSSYPVARRVSSIDISLCLIVDPCNICHYKRPHASITARLFLPSAVSRMKILPPASLFHAAVEKKKKERIVVSLYADDEERFSSRFLSALSRTRIFLISKQTTLYIFLFYHTVFSHSIFFPYNIYYVRSTRSGKHITAAPQSFNKNLETTAGCGETRSFTRTRNTQDLEKFFLSVCLYIIAETKLPLLFICNKRSMQL